MIEPERERAERRFEELGAVRTHALLAAGGLPEHWRDHAREWLTGAYRSGGVVGLGIGDMHVLIERVLLEHPGDEGVYQVCLLANEWLRCVSSVRGVIAAEDVQ
jgi:hypothetical protein